MSLLKAFQSPTPVNFMADGRGSGVSAFASAISTQDTSAELYPAQLAMSLGMLPSDSVPKDLQGTSVENVQATLIPQDYA